MRAAALLLAGLLALGAGGVGAQRLPGTAEEEARLRAIAVTLRCPVCQSESLLESQSSTAREMLVLIQEQIAEGKSDAEIRAFFRDRYGDFVLLAPPAEGVGLAIWAMPGVLGLGAAGVFATLLRRRRRVPARAAPLTEERLGEMSP